MATRRRFFEPLRRRENRRHHDHVVAICQRQEKLALPVGVGLVNSAARPL
jgi:hypothetical protein